MKKTLIFVTFLCMAVSSYADTVTRSRAESAAKAFFSKGTRASLSVTLVWDGTDGATRGSEQPPFYVYDSSSGGFVIISAEDAACPVLGFSETGSFNATDLPENVKSWFDGYRSQISYLRAKGKKQSPEVKELWDNLSSGGLLAATSVNLQTPSWGQDAPFNNMLPTVDGQKAVTGCVCTAVCEIMHHYKWPVKGSGTLPDYSYKTDKGTSRTQPGHELTVEYDWSNMLASYNRTYSSVQVKAVAQLMFDVSVMLQSAFNGADNRSTFGTSAYDEDAVAGLVKYMDYDATATIKYRDDYGDSRWASMMRAEIDAGHPMLYGGEGDYGGHAFVVDGYKDNNYFHINWGWNGVDNAWFALSSFYVDSECDFRYNQDCMFGMKKNEGGKAPEILHLYQTKNSSGISISLGTVGTSTFYIDPGYIINDGNVTVNAEFAMVLMDRKDKVKEVISSSFSTSIESGYYTYGIRVPCKLSSEVAAHLGLGDKIVFCRKMADGTYEKVTGTPAYTGVAEYAIFDVPFIDVNAAATYDAGELIPLRIVNYNQPVSSLKWYVDGSSYNDTDAVLAPGKHTLKCVVKFPDRTETLVQQITVR